MASKPTIMMISLPIDAVKEAPQFPAEEKAKIVAQLEAVPEQMRRIGVEYTFFGVTPEEAKTGLDRLRDALAATPFDGVVFGNGIRSNMPLTPWFEQLLNVVRETSPQTRVMFNTEPATAIDAVRRWFQVADS